ncbi:3'-5' exonuclease [Candidatus Woesearchaeota archaeon]|jgi:DNA polymerase III subunit alpha, Gram-positive type|nr:3'-5' exonuclease [Candidatus Woesearchaeota archaeon]MBT4387609.1 3'-5' exonuclease [Candidatus Woesearchaeota archaeon]MBT4596029.1 3'-5' exonuclease [Candidatus Woesearchaeota archaeon]MBT5740737.1 3'-5' exonuclease [Candidatus Woesearchaeota archaeon]MBT6506159.1 3'-5' exonuclease [Candidatus Woesearchaeota archaeon]
MFTVLDIETTGFSPINSKIIEVYAHTFGKKEKEFHELVNPNRPIPKSITRLTGINNNMVYNKPTIETIMPKLNKFISKSTLIVGHNISFDMRFLNYYNMKINNQIFNNNSLCTLKLVRRLLYNKQVTNHRLNTICDYFNINSNNFHRAKADTLATKELFLKIKGKLENNGFNIDDLSNLQNTPCQKAFKIMHNLI